MTKTCASILATLACFGCVDPAFIQMAPARPLDARSVATGPAADSTSTRPTAEGYLKFFVSSELSALENQSSFAGLNDDIAFLSINLETSFPGAVKSEYPLAVYDVQARTVSTVVDIDVGRSQYLSFDSGSQPTFTFLIRAIPKQFATVFTSLVKEFQEVTTPLGGVAKIVPATAPAAKMLAQFSATALEVAPVPKVSVVTRTIGLSGNPNSLLALDGRSYAVFFVRSGPEAGAHLERIANAHYEFCDSNSIRICTGSGDQKKAVTDAPYLLYHGEIVPRRPLQDFGISNIACDVAAQNVDAIKRFLADPASPLTGEQRDLEYALFERLEIVQKLRDKANVQDLDQLASAAYRAYYSRTPTSEAWSKLYVHDAPSLVDGTCFESAVSAHGVLNRVQAWKQFYAAFDMSNVWRAQLEQTPATEQPAYLEKAITTLTVPLDGLGLKTGEAYNYLSLERSAVESALRRLDQRLLADVKTSAPAARTAKRPQVLARADTVCQTCRPVVDEMIRLVMPNENAATATIDTAATLAAAKPLVTTAEALSSTIVDSADTAVVRSAQERLVSNTGPVNSAELVGATSRIRAQVQSLF